MLSDRYIKIIYKIIEHYGEEHQKRKVIEELQELIEEIEKDLAGNYNETDMTLEYSDVLVVLIQLAIIKGLSVEKIKAGIEYKLERQEKRMNNEKNKDLNCMSD